MGSVVSGGGVQCTLFGGVSGEWGWGQCAV